MDLVGADAGQAIPEENLLRFNQAFCQHNRNHFLKHIVGHEIAHLIAPKVYGEHIQAHGKEWQRVMNRVFHLPADRNHTYDLRQTGCYRFIYGCRCKGRETPLSAIRHNRRQKGVVYFCECCGGRFHFLYEDASTLLKGAPTIKNRNGDRGNLQNGSGMRSKSQPQSRPARSALSVTGIKGG